MRRRSFVASGLGLLAAAATGGLARIARGPIVSAAHAGPPQGKWISLVPFPEPPFEELTGAAANGKFYASQGLLPGFRRRTMPLRPLPDHGARSLGSWPPIARRDGDVSRPR